MSLGATERPTAKIRFTRGYIPNGFGYRDPKKKKSFFLCIYIEIRMIWDDSTKSYVSRSPILIARVYYMNFFRFRSIDVRTVLFRYDTYSYIYTHTSVFEPRIYFIFNALFIIILHITCMYLIRMYINRYENSKWTFFFLFYTVIIKVVVVLLLLFFFFFLTAPRCFFLVVRLCIHKINILQHGSWDTSILFIMIIFMFYIHSFWLTVIIIIIIGFCEKDS